MQTPDNSCTDDQYCSVDATTSDGSYYIGYCTKRSSYYSYCSYDYECASLMCLDSLCLKNAAEEGYYCSQNAHCQPHYYCDNGVCMLRGTDGASCSVDTCDYGYLCNSQSYCTKIGSLQSGEITNNALLCVSGVADGNSICIAIDNLPRLMTYEQTYRHCTTNEDCEY